MANKLPLQVICVECLLEDSDLGKPDKSSKVCWSIILADFNGSLLLALQKDSRKQGKMTIAKPEMK